MSIVALDETVYSQTWLATDNSTLNPTKAPLCGILNPFIPPSKSCTGNLEGIGCGGRAGAVRLVASKAAAAVYCGNEVVVGVLEAV